MQHNKGGKVMRVCGDCGLYRSYKDNPDAKNLDNPYDWDGFCGAYKDARLEVNADSPECRWARILRGGGVMIDEKFVKLPLSPKLLLAFEEYGKKGESLADFVTRLVLYFEGESVDG